MNKLTISTVLLLLLVMPTLCQAMPCHCFSVRDFDPQEPASADPYYLATGQNSFFSVIFNIEKKKVVFAKQKPRTTAEGLWILNWAAAQTGEKQAVLKKLKKENGSWSSALKNITNQSDMFPSQFLEILNRKGSEKELAQFIVNHLLVESTGIETKELQSLRNKQASNEETILAALIGLKAFKSPTSIFQQVATGETTWGTLLLTSGMKGREMVEEIRALIGEISKKT